jgi:hypothetical protein
MQATLRQPKAPARGGACHEHEVLIRVNGIRQALAHALP